MMDLDFPAMRAVAPSELATNLDVVSSRNFCVARFNSLGRFNASLSLTEFADDLQSLPPPRKFHDAISTQRPFNASQEQN